MITSTRRVSPDKSEVRIAFSLDDTSGNHLPTCVHTRAHTCVSVFRKQPQLILGYSNVHLTSDEAPGSTLTAFPVCLVPHAWHSSYAHTHTRAPTLTLSLKLCSFYCTIAVTGAPSISVRPYKTHTHTRSAVRLLCTQQSVHVLSDQHSSVIFSQKACSHVFNVTLDKSRAHLWCY